MRKSANKTTEAVKPASKTHTKNDELGHSTILNQRRLHDWQPSSWPFSPTDASPLTWWRTMPADLLGDAEHLLLRETFNKIGGSRVREWASAMHGDAAASFAIALPAMPISNLTLEVDLPMTALTLNALGGNAAAALVLSNVLQRTSLDHPFAKELSVSWLVLNLRRAMATRKQLAKTGCRADRAVGRGVGRSGALA